MLVPARHLREAVDQQKVKAAIWLLIPKREKEWQEVT